MSVKKMVGNWTELRTTLNLSPDDKIDLHRGPRDRFTAPYDAAMSDVENIVRLSLEEAQRKQKPYVMFTHGWSTSGPGKTTARSVVRGFMRSTKATPLIERAGCIQHETVFVAKIRPLNVEKLERDREGAVVEKRPGSDPRQSDSSSRR